MILGIGKGAARPARSRYGVPVPANAATESHAAVRGMVLNDASALSKRDGLAVPAPHSSVEGCRCHGEIVRAGDVLNDAVPVGCPAVDTVDKVYLGRCHCLPQFRAGTVPPRHQ